MLRSAYFRPGGLGNPSDIQAGIRVTQKLEEEHLGQRAEASADAKALRWDEGQCGWSD